MANNPYFDATFYFQNNPDLAVAGLTVADAYDHYVKYGANEALLGGTSRAPNPWFDIGYYYSSNPDLVNAINNGQLSVGGLLEHFANHGAAELRSPAVGVQITKAGLSNYAAKNADLREAFGIEDSANLTAEQEAALVGHFYEYGYKEKRDGAPADIDANPGQTFTLTVGLDEVKGTAGDDTIIVPNVNAQGGAATTAQAFDSIDGGLGVDTLKWYATATENNAIVPAISNVEIVRFYGAEHVNGGAIDATLVGGSEQVWLHTAAGAVNVTGLSGKALGIDGNTTGAISGDFGTAAAAALALNGAKNGANNAAVEIKGASVATLAVTGSGNVALTGLAALKTLNVAANGASTLDLAGTAGLTTVDASASTGNVTLTGNVAGVATIKTGSGNDKFSITATTKATVDAGAGNDTVTLASALAAGSVVNLGAGNDSLKSNGGSITKGAVVDGGEGVDTIAVGLINAANASGIKNFDLLDLSVAGATPLDVELVTNSTITGLVLAGGAGGASVLNVAAGTGLSVTDGANLGATTIAVKGAAAGTADSFTTTFAAKAASGATEAAPTTVAAGTVVTNGIETLNIVSGGTGFVSNTIAVTDANLQTLVITGDKALGLTFAGVNGTNVPATGGAVKLIDGSEATGALTINTANVTADNKAGVGLTINTGSGKDVITLAQKATVNAGAGDDLITSAAAGGKFTGGAGNDKFDVALAVATAADEAGAVLSTITDFTAGDSVKLLAGNTTFASVKVELGNTVTNIDQALAQFAAGGASELAANAVAWFQYGTNTYVVANDGAAGFAAGDLLVKLEGLIDLAGATLDTATDYLTLA